MRRLTVASVAAATLLTTTSGLAFAEQGASTSGSAEQASAKLKSRLEALPNVTSVTEKTATGGRLFSIDFEQPVDHRKPNGATFTQRLSLFHKSASRPMVMKTSGYYLGNAASGSEPASIVDGNTLSMEYRYFNPSRPATVNWEKDLTIWQAASDQHEVIESFKEIYDANWLTTGGSKGGMTATYHRRFYPSDVDGTVPYVAPNDVKNNQDRAYDKFLDSVGPSKKCRNDIKGLQRRVLGKDRQYYLDRVAKQDKEDGGTYTIIGSREKSVEFSAVDAYFGFFQYADAEVECQQIPDPKYATNYEVFDWFEGAVPLGGADDATLEYYAPYYFQAAYQLGAPKPYQDHLAHLMKYEDDNISNNWIPKEIVPTAFDKRAMKDIDTWVRTKSSQMLYIDGEYDPWSAEPFNCGSNATKRDCHRFVVPQGSHGSQINQLPAAQKTKATNLIFKWAGLGKNDPAVKKFRETGKPIKAVKKQQVEEVPFL